MLIIFSRQAIRNIFKSLVYHPVVEAYAVLKQMEKWSKYMYDMDSFISPQQYSEDPRREFTEFLLDAGFWDYSVEVQSKVFLYENLEIFKST